MEQKSTCQKCKAQQTFLKKNWALLLFSLYFLASAVYGTIQIVKNIATIF